MEFRLLKGWRGKAALAGGILAGMLFLAAAICVGYWLITGNSLLMGSYTGDGLDESNGVYSVRVREDDDYVKVCGKNKQLDRTRLVEFAIAGDGVETVQLRVDFRNPPQSFESMPLREGEFFQVPVREGAYQILARIVEGAPRQDGEPRVIVFDTDSARDVPPESSSET